MKRIGIDFHVVDGMFQGSRTHVLELFGRVIELCPDIQFLLFLRDTAKLAAYSRHYSLPNVSLIPMRAASPAERLCLQLPALQRRYRLDLLHTQYISPIPSFCRTVITLHDILFESHPEYFRTMFRWRSKILMRLSARRAAHVFTVSDYSQTEISRRYGVVPDRITTIHNGADGARFFPGEDGADVVSSHGYQPGEYILTVGRIEPRKNQISLVRAYAQLGRRDLPLVMIGQRDFGYESIDDEIRKLGLADCVRIIDDVNDASLAAFYRHAALFVYPTWGEGFGMPVIEAMASGTPCITSNTTCLPEIAGDAAVLISPGDVGEIRDAIARVLQDNALAREMRRSGRQRAQRFAWETAARKVAAVYQKILNDT